MRKNLKEAKLLKKFILGSIAISLAWGSSLYSAYAPFCKQVANYTMNINLDTKNNLISGTELLSWLNDTDYPTDELWFHLYWNAFKNNKSTFLQEGARRGRNVSGFLKEDWGYCNISSIKTIKSEMFEESDLTSNLEYRHPDDDNTFDQTVFTVKLPQSIEPGQSIQLEIEFQAKVPRPISRTGVYKDYYFIAQWFPKIGVFQDGQWNCHQFHTTSEFFADYGSYDVRITLPSSFIVGATGEEIERLDNEDETSTHHFFQHSVHDFAWTASPHFLEYKENFEFQTGKSTEVTLLLQPEHKKLRERYMNAVKNAIKYSSIWYGDYPYSTATCVDPAYNSRSGGMEYPTFFTGGAYFLTRKGISRPESVTIHEFGHGYFYGLVGNNEFENPWMDEGFTSFLDTEIYYVAYGEPLYSRMYFGIPVTFKDVKIPIESEGISGHRLTHNMDDMQRYSWNFMEGESYTANSYYKGELMLRTIQRFIGKELFAEMIKTYSQRWWFKHPQPQDFYDVVSEYAGRDMGWFLDQFVYGSGDLDYAIGKISNRKPKRPRGWLNGNYNEALQENTDTGTYEAEVTVRRLGEVKVPVDILIIFEDGKEIREKWDGQYRWKKFTYENTSRIQTAIVDPEFKMVLDINRTNNSMMRKIDKLAPLKWTLNWLSWVQHALEFFTFFGS